MIVNSFSGGRLARLLPAFALVLGGCVVGDGGASLESEAVAYVAPPDCSRTRDDERMCLACNVYFEARGEPFDGQLMVARVTLNRVRDDKFPESICSVLWQKGQFSWTFDRHHDRPRDRGNAWTTALSAADKALHEAADGNQEHPYLYFHATYIKRPRPGPSKIIGGHVFYAG